MRNQLLIISLCLLSIADIVLFVSFIQLRQSVSIRDETIASYQEQYVSLYSHLLHTIQLNNNSYSCIEKQLLFISKGHTHNYFVLCPTNLCTSCLLSLMDCVNEAGISTKDILYVLQSKNRFLEDEIEASGFLCVELGSVFQCFEDDGKIIVARAYDSHFSYHSFDPKVDRSLFNAFLIN